MNVYTIILHNGKETRRRVSKDKNGDLVIKYNHSHYFVEFFEQRVLQKRAKGNIMHNVYRVLKEAYVNEVYIMNKMPKEDEPSDECKENLELYWPTSGQQINRLPLVDCKVKGCCCRRTTTDCYLYDKKETTLNTY